MRVCRATSEELTASVYGGQGKARLGKDAVAIALRLAVGLQRPPLPQSLGIYRIGL